MIKRRLQQRNRQFGVEAGSPNFAQGGTFNRFAYDDEIIRQSVPETSGVALAQYLPTFAPYAWAFGGGDTPETMQPEDANPFGAGERLDRNLWGGFYYGFHPYRDHGYDGDLDDASYATLGVGYADPLYDPNQDMWHYGVPVESQPQIRVLAPWHAATARSMAPGAYVHPDRDSIGEGGNNQEFEQLNFDGSSG